MHMSYLLILVVTVAIGAFATWYVNHQIKKYSHVPNSSHMTGYQVAVGMLSYYGIEGVQVHRGGSCLLYTSWGRGFEPRRPLH